MRAFPLIRPFRTGGMRLERSEYSRVAAPHRFGRALLALAAGSLTALALPPCNLTLLLFVGATPLLLLNRTANWRRGLLYGWLWGTGFGFWSFLWLREIFWAIPVMLAPVLGLYYGLFGMLTAVWGRHVLLPEAVRQQGFTAQEAYRDFTVTRQFLWCAGVAACWVVAEFLRSGVLPWNYFGVGFHRNVVMIQLARYTGVYGLSFLAVFTDAALALALLTVARRDPESGRFRYRRPWPLLAALLLLAGNLALGVATARRNMAHYAEGSYILRIMFVQGNLSQRRFGGEESAQESLATYVKLTQSRLAERPDLILWPETAVHYPLRGSAKVSAQYRGAVRALAGAAAAPMLIGTLEFDMRTNPPGSLNSAVLTDGRDVLRDGYIAQYDKVHPVPFGEFVPFRRYLPQWLIGLIDMQRDLTPGESFAPIPVNNRVRLGVGICFEDVFPYIARQEYFRGANLLAVITNDAWYPASSEPEQHLAHAIFRAVETGLPMVRCGNDSASCVVAPTGQILWSMSEACRFGDGRPFRRGAGAAVVPVRIPDAETLRMTPYTRYGDWFAWLCVLAAGTLTLAPLPEAAARRREARRGASGGRNVSGKTGGGAAGTAPVRRHGKNRNNA